MKRLFLNILAIATVALTATACNRPKVIPDKELKNLFEEIFISNAYVSQNPQLRLDSLDMYNPILKKYGYNVDDLLYTMANFSKRKSMRLSDVVEDAIQSLEKGEKYLSERVAVLDTVNVRAQRMFKRTVYDDSLILARKISDTAKLRIKLPVENGSYDIRYFYYVDSLDKNNNLKTTFTFLDSAGRNTGTTTNWMTATKRQMYTTKLNSKTMDRTLEILFGNYPAKELKTPNLEIDSFTVIYYLPVEIALDSLDKKVIDYKISYDPSQYDTIAQDGGTLRIYPPRLPEARTDNR